MLISNSELTKGEGVRVERGYIYGKGVRRGPGGWIIELSGQYVERPTVPTNSNTNIFKRLQEQLRLMPGEPKISLTVDLYVPIALRKVFAQTKKIDY
jgi:hypothetical protein